MIVHASAIPFFDSVQGVFGLLNAVTILVFSSLIMCCCFFLGWRLHYGSAVCVACYVGTGL